jgi:GntR family transcriptional regulator, carbon starvation induced regulator
MLSTAEYIPAAAPSRLTIRAHEDSKSIKYQRHCETNEKGQAMGRPSSRQADGTVSATLATSVFDRLRSDILEGVILPGEKLRIDALRERYQVGASPLREALNRLSALHLVEQVEQRGFRVTVMTADDLQELARTRCWVSEIAVREAIAHGDAAWEEEIVLAHHRLRRYHEKVDGPNRKWELLHRRFHAALIAACPSRWIREFHETLFDLSDRVRHLSTSTRRNRDLRDVTAEHQAIMEAVVSRDTPKAIQLLNFHFSRTAEIAIATMSGGESLCNEPSPTIDLEAAKARVLAGK